MSRRRTFRPRVDYLERRCVPTTFTVTTKADVVADDKVLSLREAVTKANDLDGLDRIVFKPGLEGTIRLIGGAITIDDDLILSGPGSRKITVNGNAADRIFNIVDADPLTFKSVTIKGLTLFNGRSMGGGAIYSTENLTLIKTVITGNKAFGGGGIFSYGDKLTIRGSVIRGNEATGGTGGGIYAGNGDVVVEKSLITGNRAALDGGGISVSNYVGDPSLTIRKTTLSGNTAGEAGGAVYADLFTSDVTIENSTLAGNRASYGGGLFTKASTTTVRKSNITHNTAEIHGGGLQSNAGDLVIDGSTVHGNNALTGHGGGARLTFGTLFLLHSVVSGNRAAVNGGGVYISDAASFSTVSDCTITGNLTLDGDGGGLHAAQSQLMIDRCVISGNTALDGVGGGVAQKGSSLKMTASTVSGNRVQFNGGGVYLTNTTATSTIDACTLAANSAGGGGGGVFGLTIQPLQIQNSTISGNRATQGGAMFLLDSALATIQNSTIAFNEAGSLAGGIWLGLGDMKLDGCIVAKNRAPTSPDLYSAAAGDDFTVTVSLIGSTAGANVPAPDSTTMELFGKDPLLAPLAFNGGTTMTHALKKGSPGIDRGSNPLTLQFDQRGKPFKRKLGLEVDMGAFERQ